MKGDLRVWWMFTIRWNDYKDSLPRRYMLLSNLGSLLDGIIGLVTFGTIGSSFAYTWTVWGAKKDYDHDESKYKL